MWYFSEVQLLLVHHKLVKRFGGSEGIRDLGRIRSALNAPKQEVFGQEQYPDVYQKAAVYIRNIIADHPFVDGNKRTGTSAGLLFLQKNGLKLVIKPGELEDFAVKVATDHLDIDVIAAWLKAHSQ